MRKLFSLIIAVIFLHCTSSPTLAESLSVSLSVGTTQIAFSGYTSPNAFLTIMQNSAVIGTATADSLGVWSKTINTYTPGIQSFELYSSDSSARNTPTISYSVNLIANSLTSLENIIFPPTYSVTTSPTVPGGSLALSGLAYPSSTVTLLLSNGASTFTTASATGTFSLSTNASSTTGSYTGYLTATHPASYLSIASSSFSFTTTTPSPTPTPIPSVPTSSSSLAPSPSISPTPPLPSPSPSIAKQLSLLPRASHYSQSTPLHPSPPSLSPQVSLVTTPPHFSDYWNFLLFYLWFLLIPLFIIPVIFYYLLTLIFPK